MMVHRHNGNRKLLFSMTILSLWRMRWRCFWWSSGDADSRRWRCAGEPACAPITPLRFAPPPL